MRENDFIVSKTNPKGIITYCNPIFIEFSGYSEAEPWFTTQHHPPSRHAAGRLQTGLGHHRFRVKEFFAYVKNMSKDGGHYWVFTHIAPDFDRNGAVVGYTSVRRCPKRAAVDAIEPVHRRMVDAEKAAGARDAIGAGTAVLVDLSNKRGGL